jgi:hypothetical protein
VRLDRQIANDVREWCEELASTATNMEAHARALKVAELPEVAAALHGCARDTLAAVEALRDTLEKLTA